MSKPPSASYYQGQYGRTTAFAFVDLVNGELPGCIGEVFQIKDRWLNYHIPVLYPGDVMPDRMEYAIIIYQNTEWHMSKAYELTVQLNNLYPGIHILGIPVGVR